MKICLIKTHIMIFHQSLTSKILKNYITLSNQANSQPIKEKKRFFLKKANKNEERSLMKSKKNNLNYFNTKKIKCLNNL